MEGALSEARYRGRAVSLRSGFFAVASLFIDCAANQAAASFSWTHSRRADCPSIRSDSHPALAICVRASRSSNLPCSHWASVASLHIGSLLSCSLFQRQLTNRSWGLPLLRSLRPFKYLSGNQPATHLCEKDPSGRQPVVDDIGTGRVLASGAVMDAVRDAPLGFEPLEEVTLKGIPEPVPLYRVTRGETARR